MLAGFAAAVDDWLAFTDGWKASLDRDGLAYFKASEANRMDGEFRRGWNRSLIEQKTDELATIAAKYVKYRLHVVLSWADYNSYIGTVRSATGLIGSEWDNPYFICFYSLAARFARFQSDNKLEVDKEFIFDEQGKVGENAADIIKGLKANPIIVKGFGGIPSFKSDKKVQPLQTADLFAWNVRDYILGDSPVPKTNISVKRTLFDIPPAVSFRIGRDMLMTVRADLLAAGFMIESAFRDYGLIPN